MVSEWFNPAKNIFFHSHENLNNSTFSRIRRFPPKTRLLTSEEFHAQSVLETTKALEELKSFCSSPESKPWKMMTRLKNPQRFVSFSANKHHLLFKLKRY